jgi:hypothetical protein
MDKVAPKIETITSKTKALSVIGSYIDSTKALQSKIFDFVCGLGGFRDKSVVKDDILFLFIRAEEEASAGSDPIRPAEDALVRKYTTIHPHFTYTQNKKAVDSDDDTDDSYYEGDSGWFA